MLPMNYNASIQFHSTTKKKKKERKKEKKKKKPRKRKKKKYLSISDTKLSYIEAFFSTHNKQK